MEKTKIEIEVTKASNGCKFFKIWQVYYQNEGENHARDYMKYLSREAAENSAASLRRCPETYAAIVCEELVFI